MKDCLEKYTLVIIVLATLVFGNTKDLPEKMQVSKEFQNFMINKDYSGQTSIENNYGLIPGPQQISRRLGVILSKPMYIPLVYDLRALGGLTPVRDQKSCDCCWSFATIAQLESQILQKYSTNLDLSEQQLIMHNGYDPPPCVGGNAYFASAMLLKGEAPVSEFAYPYLDYERTDHYIKHSRYKVNTINIIPNDKDIIKSNIMEKGPLYSTMYWSGAYYNGITNIYAYPGKSYPNHAVLLVGWNDTLKTDVGKGAWIVKNSWGEGFGEDGYFYISYQDSSINSKVVHWDLQKNDNDNRFVGGYDDVGFVGNIGYGDGLDYGLMRYTAEQDEKIYQIATWALSGDSEIGIEVYDNFNNNLPQNLITKSRNKKIVYAGYHTFELMDTVYVNNGQDIYIRIKYETNGIKYPLPVEYYLENYSNPSIESDRFWISNKGNSWSRLNSMKCDICINVIGLYRQEKITLNTNNSIELYEDLPANYYLRNLTENNFSTHIYNIENRDLIQAYVTNDTIKVIPAENSYGKANIELYHSNDNSRFFDTLQVNVLPVADPPISKDTLIYCNNSEKVILYKDVFPFYDIDSDSLKSISISSVQYPEFRKDNHNLAPGDKITDFNNFYFQTDTDNEEQIYFFEYKIEDSQGMISDSTYKFSIKVKNDSKPKLEIKLK